MALLYIAFGLLFVSGRYTQNVQIEAIVVDCKTDFIVQMLYTYGTVSTHVQVH